MSHNIIHITPWPIKAYTSPYPDQMLPLPRTCEFVCAYTVDLGLDIIEEAIYIHCKPRGLDSFSRLMLVSALGLPNDLNCSQRVIKNLKKTGILQYGEVIRMMGFEEKPDLATDLFKLVLKKRKGFDRPRDFIAGNIIKKRQFNRILRDLNMK